MLHRCNGKCYSIPLHSPLPHTSPARGSLRYLVPRRSIRSPWTGKTTKFVICDMIYQHCSHSPGLWTCSPGELDIALAGGGPCALVTNPISKEFSSYYISPQSKYTDLPPIMSHLAG